MPAPDAPHTAVAERRRASNGVMYRVNDADALKAALGAARISYRRAGDIAGVSPAAIDHLANGRNANLAAAAAEPLIAALTDAGVDDARGLFTVPTYTPPAQPKP